MTLDAANLYRLIYGGLFGGWETDTATLADMLCLPEKEVAAICKEMEREKLIYKTSWNTWRTTRMPEFPT